MIQMKRQVWIYVVPVFIILTVLLLLWLAPGHDRPDFIRAEISDVKPDSSRFRVNQQIGKLYFKRKDKEIYLEHIPSIAGNYFYLNGEKQVVIEPRLTGDVGFYTHLHFQSYIKRKPMAFLLEVESGGKSRKISTLQFGRMSRSLFHALKLKAGDVLRLTFRGTGTIYFSRPIIYRRKPALEQSHVFLIGVDTLRGDHIGLQVKGKSLTPNIDRFVRDGVCFKNGYSQSPWTIPSFVSLFTGLYEFNHRVDIRHPLALDIPVLTENLSERFITFGLHGGNALDGRWGYHRGFDAYKELPAAGPLFPEGGRALFNQAISVLEKSRFPQMFFFLHTYQVHSPYTPPREFLYRLNPSPKNLELTAISHGNLPEKYKPVEAATRESLLELYQAEVMAFDCYFGEFIRNLKEMNLYDQSFIILMSDHGEEFYEHKGWEHCHSMYDELIRVPIILKFPGNRFKGRKIREPAGVIDILPTLLKYYDISFDEKAIDGINLLPGIENGGFNEREFVMSSVSVSRYILALPPRMMFRFKDYKLIYNFPLSEGDPGFFAYSPPEVPRFELFDLGKDPLETHNLISTERDRTKRFMPLILDIKKRIQGVLKNRAGNSPRLDRDVQKKLETLGYL